MALTQIYTAVGGHVITAARWNNEFGNLYTNGTDVAFPLTKAVSFAGYTVTYDIAGVSHITSPASTGFLMTVGAKTGAPGANGGLATITAGVFTDSSTLAGGTADLWAGFSVRIPTVHAAAAGVTTTDAATVYIEGAPIAGTNQTFSESSALFVDGKLKVDGDIRLRTQDSRTNTVLAPMTVQATTTGTPAAGIGVGISFHAESQDEAPAVLGRTDFAFSDVTSGSEDSYFDILLRTAGAAANTAWRWARTTAFKGIFTHANTADRTYTFPDFSCRIDPAGSTTGPTSMGASSTRTHEGTVTISASQILEGVHYYTDFTLDAGDTLTMNAGAQRLIIVATGTITINGTIDTASGGSAGGAGGAAGGGTVGNVGSTGYSQPGGAGGANEGPAQTGGYGGPVYLHSVLKSAGGVPAGGVGGAGTSLTGSALQIGDPFSICGGAGGGGGAGGTADGGAGGRGAGSIVLIAPNIVLGAASFMTTSGSAGGGSDNNAFANGAGGGGGAGNIYMFCQSYTDGGCTFTQAGGAGGADGGPGFAGGAGADGILQINIYGA